MPAINKAISTKGQDSSSFVIIIEILNFLTDGAKLLGRCAKVICTVYQGRSCKQICWPPGVGGLQRVGLDPGQHDHHPHGVVHVGQLQDVS